MNRLFALFTMLTLSTLSLGAITPPPPPPPASPSAQTTTLAPSQQQLNLVNKLFDRVDYNHLEKKASPSQKLSVVNR